VPPPEGGARGGVRGQRPRREQLAGKATNGLCHLYADRPTSEHEQPPSNPDLAAKSPQEGTEYSLDEI
jgi:hypothetical protein